MKASKSTPPESKKPGDAEAPPMEAANAPENAEAPVPAKKPVRLGEKLVALGLISLDQLEIVLTEQKSSKKLFGAILVEMGFITESALGEVLAESSGTERFDPKSSMLDSTV